ncbi:serine hydrolase domain-containing protein [Pseudonocardia nigra]|uniref:serine hydrolase domain-containing protein n=1 Tax=Pseudonocardia nigra TaxID=1921578 RepID=UPI001C5FA432|nr:serine hydrolase domain-containing protein [Pseudonocardia nigra]
MLRRHLSRQYLDDGEIVLVSPPREREIIPQPGREAIALADRANRIRQIVDSPLPTDVLLERAGNRPLGELLRARLLDPLGMTDTGFVASPGRLPPCFAVTDSGLVMFDDTVDSRWARPPSFPDARGGLVSTAADLLRFAAALLDGGGDILTASSTAAMTSDRLTAEQRQGPSAQAFLDGHGWGYGVQVVTSAYDESVLLPRYGWGGELGTLWYSWPEQGTAAVLLTQVLPPPRNWWLPSLTPWRSSSSTPPDSSAGHSSPPRTRTARPGSTRSPVLPRLARRDAGLAARVRLPAAVTSWLRRVGCGSR